jgi:hypothetical protein
MIELKFARKQVFLYAHTSNAYSTEWFIPPFVASLDPAVITDSGLSSGN